jgi:predicted SprT family Zn-dependent metalloprotease
MAVDIIYMAWRDIAKRFSDAPLPLLVPTKRLRKAGGMYKPSENTIYISIKHIEEVLKNYGVDEAYCEARSVIMHELKHFIDINMHKIYSKKALEKNALFEELKEFKKCLEEKNIKI